MCASSLSPLGKCPPGPALINRNRVFACVCVLVARPAQFRIRAGRAPFTMNKERGGEPLEPRELNLSPRRVGECRRHCTPQAERSASPALWARIRRTQMGDEDAFNKLLEEQLQSVDGCCALADDAFRKTQTALPPERNSQMALAFVLCRAGVHRWLNSSEKLCKRYLFMLDMLVKTTVPSGAASSARTMGAVPLAAQSWTRPPPRAMARCARRQMGAPPLSRRWPPRRSESPLTKS